MYDTTDVEEFNTAQKRLEPNSSNGFVNLDWDEAGKVSPVHETVSINVRKNLGRSRVQRSGNSECLPESSAPVDEVPRLQRTW